MVTVQHGIRTLAGEGSFSMTEAEAYEDAMCPYCGAPKLVRVARLHVSGSTARSNKTRWLRCPSCMRGAVIQDDILHPSAAPLREPVGLPELDRLIWSEVRTCLGSGANAAAVMLCRKLLFHIAVAHGLPAKDAKDRAPTFLKAVEHLEAEGVFTAKMRKWVDRIKDVGNDANHELTPITPGQALDVATFTEQLLVLAYELDALMADPAAAED